MRNTILFATVATCMGVASYALTQTPAEYFWHVMVAYACGVIGMATFIALKHGSKAQQIEAMAKVLYEQNYYTHNGMTWDAARDFDASCGYVDDDGRPFGMTMDARQNAELLWNALPR